MHQVGVTNLVPPYGQNIGSIKSCPQGHPEVSSQVSFKLLPDEKGSQVLLNVLFTSLGMYYHFQPLKTKGERIRK